MDDPPPEHGHISSAESVARVDTGAPPPAFLQAAIRWLGGTRPGLVVMALIVGGGAGLGAALFRELIFGITWMATGYQQFGQQGHAPSLHLPWLGIFFVLIIPVVGGLVYGPLIQRFAREARGHGVPEVMVSVAENGGRIRPPVTVVKALASAICIGVGGSVGREGPIVQIGSALASTVGQLVRMPESRLRIIVACGAAGGIAATFNAPITGLFFGFEIVLREFSLDALFATMLAAVTGDVISRALFGSAPFLAGAPHGLTVPNDWVYLLVCGLALACGLIGVGFKTFLYKLEDVVDGLWKGRPEWARPAVGGAALGLLLLALPQMYGVGYPVMDRVLANHEVLWFIVILLLGKVLAASLTLSIGGSGGVFAPSLFTGAAAGMAFGVIVHQLFGPVVGPPAIYGVVAMGGVFAAAAQAPLTSIASVVEMTANFGLTVPIMLACGVASALSKRLSYGSIYTTKLLRRGVDIERPKTESVLHKLRVADVMTPLSQDGPLPVLNSTREPDHNRRGVSEERLTRLVAPVTAVRAPQALFADETLEQALRQLVLYGGDGLPVLSHDGGHLEGWITRRGILEILGDHLTASAGDAERGAAAAGMGTDQSDSRIHLPTTPLKGYEIVELTITSGAPARDRPLGEVPWPPGAIVAAATQEARLVAPRSELKLVPGSTVVLLVPQGTGHSLAAPTR